MGKQGKKKKKRKYNPKRRTMLQPQRKPENPMRKRMAELNQLAAIVKGNAILINRAREREAERKRANDSQADI